MIFYDAVICKYIDKSEVQSIMEFLLYQNNYVMLIAHVSGFI